MPPADFAMFCWLTLCGMLLFSRILFIRKGTPWVKRFFLAWIATPARYVWALGALLVGIRLLLEIARSSSHLTNLELFVGVTASAVLILDGIANAILSKFAWIADIGGASPSVEAAGKKDDAKWSLDRLAQFNLALATLAVCWSALLILFLLPPILLILQSLGVAIALLVFFVMFALRCMNPLDEPKFRTAGTTL